jgi:glycosyltransferase involved in cell wall biosynthesis
VARVALVHDVAGVAAAQAKLLRDAGHEVDLVALPDFGAAWSWPAKGLAIPVRLAAYLPVVNRLRREKYDIVHIHWLAQGIVGLLIGQPFFAQAHGSDLHLNLRNPVYRRVTKAVLDRAKLVFFVTPNLPAYMKGYEAKLRYLPNPVHVDGIASSVTPPARVAKVLIFTRLDPVKGVERIFPAVAELSKAVQLTALDWGPLARQYVQRYGSSVQFVPPVPHAEIGSFLQRFDLVIGQMGQGILSLSEIEALAAGRPLITAVDWSLYDDDRPPVVRASSPHEIIAAVEQLMSNPQRLASLSREGREWVRRNHSPSRHLQVLEASYFGRSVPDMSTAR